MTDIDQVSFFGLVSFNRESEGEQPKQTDVQSPTSQAGSAPEDGQLIRLPASNKTPPKPRPRRFISAEMVMMHSLGS